MEKKWWQEAVVYQIYCKSFLDTDGDGIGDLNGVLQKLDYIKELGANCIWFNPLYVSPQVDNGYDIADYMNIDPAYGTLDDFKRVLSEAHKRGIRILMDMVLNHTSDEHKWFIESRKSKDNPYRDYYIWHPGKNGKEPNNWGNYFFERSGSAWQYDERTGEYYLHQYSYKMPDLNWDCEALREEMYSMMRWWLDMGVDGFRLDVINILKKPAGFPDSKAVRTLTNTKNGFIADRMTTANAEGIHDLLKEINKNVFSKYDILTVGEISMLRGEATLPFFSQDAHEIDTVFIFDVANRNDIPASPREIKDFQKLQASMTRKNAWVTQFLNNHDLPRQVSRFGNDGKYRVESAKALATMIHTLPGTPFIYQGEEIGMTNVFYPSIKDYNDRYTVGQFDALTKNGLSPEEAMAKLRPISRDNARSPFQWNDRENAGFTSGKPWIKVGDRYKEINAKKDLSSPDSVYKYYQKLISLRKTHPAIVDGLTEFVDYENENVIAYTRSTSRETLLVILNFSDSSVNFDIGSEFASFKWKKLLANYADATTVPEKSEWRPWECAVYSLEYRNT